MPVQNIECQLVRAQIGRYLGGEPLSQEAMRQLEVHLVGCDECRAAISVRKSDLRAKMATEVQQGRNPKQTELPLAAKAAIDYKAVQAAAEAVADTQPAKARKSLKAPNFTKPMVLTLILGGVLVGMTRLSGGNSFGIGTSALSMFGGGTSQAKPADAAQPSKPATSTPSTTPTTAGTAPATAASTVGQTQPTASPTPTTATPATPSATTSAPITQPSAQTPAPTGPQTSATATPPTQTAPAKTAPTGTSAPIPVSKLTPSTTQPTQTNTVPTSTAAKTPTPAPTKPTAQEAKPEPSTPAEDEKTPALAVHHKTHHRTVRRTIRTRRAVRRHPAHRVIVGIRVYDASGDPIQK